MVGVIAANDVLLARRAAKLVKLEYKELPALVELKDAIVAKSLLGKVRHFGKSEYLVNESLVHSYKVLEGESSLGSQEHFYLETQSSLVIPGEGDES